MTTASALALPDRHESLAVLHRTLRRNGGFFAFIPVVVDEASRADVLRRLRAWSGADGVPVLTEFPSGAEGAAKLDELLRGVVPRVGGVVFPDGDALVNTDEGRLAAGLNLARDQIRQWVAGPLVVLLSEKGAVALAKAAPDLHDVRQGVFDVVERQVFDVVQGPLGPPNKNFEDVREEVRGLHMAKKRH